MGVSAMALAALSAMGAGCTGGEEEDDDTGFTPGGIINLTVGQAGVTSSGSFSEASVNYAEFYSDYTGTFESNRDIPIDTCINPLTPGGGTPTYDTSITSVSAVSGGTTIDYAFDDPGFYVDQNYPSAPDDADYEVSVDGSVLGTISVPPGPGTVSVTGDNTVSWTTMGAQSAFILIINDAQTSINLCHTADDGEYDFSALSLTSGFAWVAGANYAEAELNGRDVLLQGVGGDVINDVPAFF